MIMYKSTTELLNLNPQTLYLQTELGVKLKDVCTTDGATVGYERDDTT